MNKFLIALCLFAIFHGVIHTEMKCDLGQYYTGTECSSCKENVAICDETTSIICFPGYILSGLTCIPQCKDGTFFDENLQICIACEEFCTKCNGYNTCTNCQANYILTDIGPHSYCQSKCKFQEYVNPDTQKCVQCNLQNCLVCESSEICKSCMVGFYLSFDQKKCTALCEKNQYYDQAVGQCIQCPYYCDTCISSQKCLTCNDQGQQQGDICVNKCSTNQYYEIATKKCTVCPLTCATCLGQKQCLTCTTGFIENPISNLCFSCQSNEFFDYTRDECIACPTKCLKCKNDKTCLACSKNFQLVNNLCQYICDIRQQPNSYYEKETDKCIPCTDNQCTQCHESQYSCEVCKKGFKVVDGVCVNECDETGQYFSSVTQKCEPCNKFTKFLICSQCHEGASLEIVCDRCNAQYEFNDDIQQCVRRCPLGKYFEGRECVDCQQRNCLDCVDSQQCLTCAKDYFLSYDQKKCDYICPIGYYFDDLYKRCFQCIENCDHCERSENLEMSCNADGCSDQADPIYDNIEKITTCALKCIDGEFYNVQLQECKDCPARCSTCKSNTQCKLCNEKNGFFNHPITKECVFKCKPKQRYNYETKQCEDCGDSNCLVCTESISQCLACLQGYNLIEGKCVYKCKADEYFDIINNSCNQCSLAMPGCDKCTINEYSDVQCSNCYGYYKLQNNQCVKACDIKSYYNKANQKCEKCIDNCLLCKDGTTCESCTIEYKLSVDKKQCVYKCSGSTYFDIFKQACLNCIPYCSSCKAAEIPGEQCEASKCYEGVSHYDAQTKKCISECPQGQYPIRPHECVNCDIDNCEQCQNDMVCIVCKYGYILDDKFRCIEACKLGEYYNDNTQSCKKCYPGCATCTGSDPHDCLSCLYGYDFNKETTQRCEKKCAEGQFTNIKTETCDICQKSYTSETPVGYLHFCDKCLNFVFKPQPTDNNNLHCYHCQFQFSLNPQTNLCEKKCDLTEYYWDGKCHTCSNLNCDVCELRIEIQTTVCLQCKDGYLLKDKVCIERCTGLKYWNMKTEQCEDCLAKENCAKCDSTFPYCLECQKGFQIATDHKKCNRFCEDNEFFDLPTLQCIKSSIINCKVIKPVQNYCETCNLGYYLRDGQCFNIKCEIGFFFDREENKCMPCMDNCLECFHVIQCTKCKPPYYGAVCTAKCPAGTYYEKDQMKCLPCRENCNSCTSYDICDECNAKTYPDKGMCKLCSDALDYCEECSSQNSCTKCQQSFETLAGKCTRKCEVGQYFDDTRCQACAITHCKDCIAVDICEECEIGFQVDENDQCIEQTCPAGFYYDKKEQKCKSCSKGCSECSDYNTCNKCLKGHELIDNKCTQVNRCPTGLWYDQAEQEEYLKCKSCKINCVFCTTGLDCQKCQQQFFVNTKQICEKCGKGCLDCKNAEYCTACQADYKLVNRKCVFGSRLGIFSLMILLIIAFFF